MVAGSLSGEKLAARLAPHIDRLFVAVHRAAGPHARTLRHCLGIERFGVLIDLRRQLVRDHEITLAAAMAKERYRDRDEVWAVLADDVRHGLLVHDGDRFRPSPIGWEALRGLTAVQADRAETLWTPAGTLLAEAAWLARTAVKAAHESLNRRDYPAFFLEAGDGSLETSERAMGLWLDLSSLRYLRADAHGRAWAEAGLSATEIGILTALCHRNEPLNVNEDGMNAPAALVAARRTALRALWERGWVENQGDEWSVSEAGHDARQAIEAATNRYSAPACIGLGARGDRFLELLTALPDSVVDSPDERRHGEETA